MTRVLLRWDPARRYRAFVHRPTRVATIVSSHIADEVSVHRVGGVVVTLDREGFVCDLEVELDAKSGDAKSGAHAGEMPAPVERLTEPVTTTVESGQVGIDITDEAVRLLFGGQHLKSRWHQLADEPVFLRLDGDSRLLALAVKACNDSDGSAESRWLDEIDGPPRDEGRRVTV